MKRTFVDFSGQICLVTGAGSASGIGFETAKILGGLGAKIALTSTTERIHERAAELAAEGIEARAYIADLMDRAQVKKLVEDVIADFGSIDVLINNAGMVQTNKAEEDFSHIADMTYENWDTSIDRNLNITFNVTKCVLPYMIKSEYGRIVNVSSVTGPVVSNPGGLQCCKSWDHRHEQGSCDRSGSTQYHCELCPARLDRHRFPDRKRSCRRAEHALKTQRPSGRSGQRDRIPGIPRKLLYHRRVFGRGRRQYHPGIQRPGGVVLLVI